MNDGMSQEKGKGPVKVLATFLSVLASRIVADWFNDWRKRHGL